MKVLLSSFLCAPNKGSELGNGWYWANSLADRGHEVTVLTLSDFREQILVCGPDRYRLPFHRSCRAVLAVEAFAELRRSTPAKLIMVGDGPLREQVRATIDRLGIAEDVQLLGQIEWTAILPLYDSASVSCSARCVIPPAAIP